MPKLSIKEIEEDLNDWYIPNYTSNKYYIQENDLMWMDESGYDGYCEYLKIRDRESKFIKLFGDNIQTIEDFIKLKNPS